VTTADMSANVEGRGVSMSCSSPPVEGRFSDSTVTLVQETLNVCRMTQSMIDIAAKQLFGLRQCQTSEDLIQKEICECEVCLLSVFLKFQKTHSSSLDGTVAGEATVPSSLDEFKELRRQHNLVLAVGN